MEILHQILNVIVDVAIWLFELMGIIVIIISGIQGMIQYFRHDQFFRLKLARGMATALEFKIGSEILRTVVVRDLSEILTVAGIIILRGALAFLIQWEIKLEENGTSNFEKIK